MAPAMRAVAFDAMVNHGNDPTTWAMIEAANGDPYKLIELRRDYYRTLIYNDPKKNERYKSGWDRRLQELTEYVGAQGEVQEYMQVASLADPAQIERVKGLIPEAMAAQERKAQAEKSKRISEYNAAEKDLINMFMTSPENADQRSMDALRQLAANTGEQEFIDRVDAVEGLRQEVELMKGMTPEQLAQKRRAVSAAYNRGEAPNGPMMIETIDKMVKMNDDGIKRDGFGFFARQGWVRPPEPLTADPDQFRREVLARQDATISIVSRQGGKPLPILTPDEIQTLGPMIETMPPNQAAAFLVQFNVLETPTKATLAAALDEKSSTLATALMVDDDETIRKIIYGERIIKTLKPEFDDKALNAKIMEEIGPMTSNTRFLASAQAAIRAYYVATATEKGDAVDDNIKPDYIEQAITDIYGPRVDIAGWGTNYVFNFKDPSTGDYVPEDEIYDMFNGITDEDLVKIIGGPLPGAMGETVTADDIMDGATIMSAGNGKYSIRFDEIGDLYHNGRLVQIDGVELLKLHRKKIKAAKISGFSLAGAR